MKELKETLSIAADTVGIITGVALFFGNIEGAGIFLGISFVCRLISHLIVLS